MRKKSVEMTLALVEAGRNSNIVTANREGPGQEDGPRPEGNPAPLHSGKFYSGNDFGYPVESGCMYG